MGKLQTGVRARASFNDPYDTPTASTLSRTNDQQPPLPATALAGPATPAVARDAPGHSRDVLTSPDRTSRARGSWSNSAHHNWESGPPRWTPGRRWAMDKLLLLSKPPAHALTVMAHPWNGRQLTLRAILPLRISNPSRNHFAEPNMHFVTVPAHDASGRAKPAEQALVAAPCGLLARLGRLGPPWGGQAPYTSRAQALRHNDTRNTTTSPTPAALLQLEALHGPWAAVRQALGQATP